jgi:D-xylose transport system substrate-binding protein
MRYLKVLVIGLVTLFLISSCTKEKFTIGFMLPHLNAKRYVVERDIFNKKVNELGGEVLFYSADNDPEKQMNQLDEMFAKGVDIIVLDPVNRFTAAGMVRKIHEKGLKVISYDRLIANCDPDAFISFDARIIGEQMASFAISKKPEGNYAIFAGDKSDVNALWINEGFNKILKPYISSGKIKVTYETYLESWSEADANFTLDKYIRYNANVPDVILSSSDLITRGCIDALLKNGYSPKNVILTGMGAEPFACRFMLQGIQSISVYKSVKKLASLAADLSVKMVRSENTSEILSTSSYNGKFDIPTSFLETQMVDSSKIRSIVMADGMLTEDELKK